MGTAFVVEHQHLHALCSLSTPTAAKEEPRQKGEEKFPVRVAEKVNQVKFGRQSDLGGASILDFSRCNFSGNVTHFILWSVKLIS